ncbi:phosphoglycerate mutase-like protein [Pisolithus croceorrhizus]|nr:phosphoglycerate mutase-like protein [Pisolithus croceorrhizus]
MVNASTSAGLIGVVLLARHGDRTSTLYQDPATYNSTQGYLSALGAEQEYELGQFLRNTYLNPGSSSYIQGANTDVVDVDQLYVRADAGGGNVILDSAYALLQGLYPPTKSSAITLANGKVATPPLDGYQYVPVESLEFWQAPALTSWMDCEYFDLHLSRLNSGVVFKDLTATAAPFLQAVTPYLNGLNNSFLNMWNIYDYINVQYTHNKTFYENFPVTLLEQARYFANQHEQNVFTDSVINGVGQIAIRTLWPEMLWSLGNMTLPSNKVKIALTEVDYKPFISLFNVTNATVTNPNISGIADYASVVALELSQDSQGQYNVAMKFKNGTNDNQFHALKFWGSDSITLDNLIHAIDSSTINSTVNWCFSCNQTVLRGCSVFNYSNDPFLTPTSATGY